MELTYRGQRYQTSLLPSEEPSLKKFGTEFSCKYRGASYQLKLRRATVAGAPQSIDLTYRGVSYTRTL
ncbi:MAG: DUF4278 domain-containing protein [Cyanobacteria bacterium J06636_16]